MHTRRACIIYQYTRYVSRTRAYIIVIIIIISYTIAREKSAPVVAAPLTHTHTHAYILPTRVLYTLNIDAILQAGFRLCSICSTYSRDSKTGYAARPRDDVKPVNARNLIIILLTHPLECFNIIIER